MKRSAILLLHLSYWFAYFMLCAIGYGVLSQTESIPPEELRFYGGVIIGVAIVPALVSFYTFYFFLFPRYLQQRKISHALISGILVSFACFFIAALTLRFTANMGWSCYGQSNYVAILIVAFISFINGVVAFVIRGFITWFQEIKMKEALLKKNHEMELALVKSQLDPHFLFNTLNNIDVLILGDAEKASTYLNKLSDIMRFMLFETKTEKIPLEQELEYIHKYVELQKIRTANEHYVTYTVEGDSSSRKIAPLVFIPFIENAFKHTNNKKLKDAIRIKVHVNGASVNLTCENRLDPSRINPAESNGLGNDLIAKRLKLLYPKQHHLEIENDENSYKVSLDILYEAV